MYSKKIIVLSLIISMILSIFINCTSLAASNIEINMSKENDQSIILKVSSEKNIKNISIYLRRENTEYQLFYKSNSVNSKNKTYKISRTRLSTEQETYFKVIVEDDEGTEKTQEFKGEKRTETQKPSTTPKPSSSAKPTQSSPPSNNPSLTTTASSKPSNSPSPTPSQSPAQTEVTSIKLNNNTLSMYVGNSKTIKATITPANAKTKITWSTSNSKVATVTSGGKITAKKAGTATITVRTSNGKTAQCKVTVKEKAKTSNLMNIPKIYQTDPKYASYRFPVHTSSTISGNGCGIVSTTMILRYLTGKNIQVETVATWADRNGHFNGTGANGSIFNAAAQKWNVGNAKLSNSITEVKKALLDGRPVVMYCKSGSKALFTNNKHFIVLTGIDKNGKIHVNNPNKGKREGAFTTAEIEDARLNYYIFDKKK